MRDRSKVRSGDGKGRGGTAEARPETENQSASEPVRALQSTPRLPQQGRGQAGSKVIFPLQAPLFERGMSAGQAEVEQECQAEVKERILLLWDWISVHPARNLGVGSETALKGITTRWRR